MSGIFDLLKGDITISIPAIIPIGFLLIGLCWIIAIATLPSLKLYITTPDISNTKDSSLPSKSFLETTHEDFDDATDSNLTVNPLIRRPSYRMDEETEKYRSSEYSARGRVWSNRPSWHLSSAPRLPRQIDQNHHYYDHVLSILKRYEVDPNRGFLPSSDPLQRLPFSRYHIWEDLGDDLPKLLCAGLGQARDPLKQLPVLSIDKLLTDGELRRAHLLLCLFAHAFVWGGPEPLDYIPEGIAKPLTEVSEKLGIPPVLGHPSIVLYNWRRFDIHGDISMENLSTLNNFFDGRDESWFYLITVEIEAKGAAAILPMMLAIDAISRLNEERSEGELSRSLDDNVDTLNPIRPDEELSGNLTDLRVAAYVTMQLQKISAAIKQICNSLSAMREGCHPFIFYHRVRPFLSGWKQNPTLPQGIIYHGVNENKRYQYYGGSAAQSSLIPFLDIGLGISHDSTRSRDFLLAMRDYMVKPHRNFLAYLESVACIREFVINRLDKYGVGNINVTPGVNDPYVKTLSALREAYDACVDGVKNFRTGHITLVADYIMSQQKKDSIASSGGKKSLEESAGGKGTGGTDLMKFLKPIRDNCEESIINRPGIPTQEIPSAILKEAEKPPEVEPDSYVKDNGDFEDIDLYRGGHSFNDGNSQTLIWRQ